MADVTQNPTLVMAGEKMLLSFGSRRWIYSVIVSVEHHGRTWDYRSFRQPPLKQFQGWIARGVCIAMTVGRKSGLASVEMTSYGMS